MTKWQRIGFVDTISHQGEGHSSMLRQTKPLSHQSLTGTACNGRLEEIVAP